MNRIILIAHDIRSTHNVGSLLRTAEGIGVEKVYMTGYTPYPSTPNDSRLPHLAQKISKDIHKTALNAEATQAWEHYQDLGQLLELLKAKGYEIAALEQTRDAINLPEYSPSKNIALLLGNEVNGIDQEILKLIEIHLIIPMYGKKESYNVVQAAAMALYHFRFR